MEPSSTVGWMATAVASSRELEDFEAVVRLYWPKVFRFALASLRDSHAAETLAQDCFFRAYRARDRFRGEASVSTWLMQIAVNLVPRSRPRSPPAVLEARAAHRCRREYRRQVASGCRCIAGSRGSSEAAGTGSVGRHRDSVRAAEDGLPATFRGRYGTAGDSRRHRVEGRDRKGPPFRSLQAVRERVGRAK